MVLKSMVKVTVLAMMAVTLGACGQSGPSDELVSMEMVDTLNTITGGYVTYDVSVLEREEVSSDVLKVKIQINGYRNDKELQVGHTSAIAQRTPLGQALRLQYGHPWPEEKLWLTYTKDGDKWELRF